MLRRSRTVLGWFGQVFAWLVIIGVVAVLAVAVVVPRLAGATPYTVLTGSMEPTYPPGTLVVTKPVPVDQIGTGDVITFQRESGSATVVTHRVVAVGSRTDGETVYTTKGDANNTEDVAPVRTVQVRGRVWYAVPYAGYVNNALNGRERQFAVLGVSGLLVGYAAFMFVGAIRERRRRGNAPDPQPPPAVPVSQGVDVTPDGRRPRLHVGIVVAGALIGIGVMLALEHYGPRPDLRRLGRHLIHRTSTRKQET